MPLTRSSRPSEALCIRAMKLIVLLGFGLPLALTLGCTNQQSPKAPPAESVESADVSAAPTSHGLPPAAASSAPREAVTAAMTPNVRLYVGSGDWGSATGAISVLGYDPATGAINPLSRVDAGGLLSFLVADSQRRFLYAADEEQKKLRSFAISASDGSLTPVATTDTIAGPVYVSVPRSDRFILAAQFNSGKTEVFELQAGGGFGKRTAEVSSGKESHAVFLAPDERFVFVPGRGSDRVQTFAFDSVAGALQPAAATSVPKGAGARHFDFHPNGKFAYLINEFANTIVSFTYDSHSGRLAEIQTISTNPDVATKSSAADLHVHPSGRFLYATNRPAGADGSIVVYSIAEDGKLTFVQKESTQGQVPRNFHIIANGTRIVVGNQESKSIMSYSVDATAGTLAAQKLTPVAVKPFFVCEL
jgi:6-phosphogluconolactonase